MIKPILLLGVMISTAFGNNDETQLDSSQTTSTPPEHNHAIAWIENHLAPVHSVKGHVARKSIPDAMVEYKIPGISMVFVDQGRIAWKQAYGYANLDTQQKVTEHTVFTGASLSKPLAAMAARKLVENHQLSLDENVNLKLQGWQIPDNEFTAVQKVTLRHLLSHRAGIKNDLWSSYLSLIHI